jgi:hypothetical protein
MSEGQRGEFYTNAGRTRASFAIRFALDSRFASGQFVSKQSAVAAGTRWVGYA